MYTYRSLVFRQANMGWMFYEVMRHMNTKFSTEILVEKIR